MANNEEEKSKARGLSSAVVQTVKTGLPVLPIAVGAGISAHSIYQNRNKLVDLFANTQLSKNSPTQDAVRNLLRNSATPSFNDVGAQIAGLAGSTSTLTSNHVLTAWQQAAKGLPDQQRAFAISDRLANLSSPTEMMNALAEELRGDSIYHGRVGRTFIENVRAMQRHTSLGFSLDMTSIPRSRTFKTSLRMRSNSPITKSLLNMGKSLRTDKIEAFRKTGSLPGSTVFVRMTGGDLGNAKLKFRFAEEIADGIVATGVGGQTHNISGKFGIFEGGRIKSTLNYQEWVLLRAQTELVPKIRALNNPTQKAINRITREFESNIRKPLEYIPSLFGAEVEDAFSLQRANAASIMHIVDPSGNAFEGRELESLVKGLGSLRTPSGDSLYPHSPNRIIGSTFSTRNPALSRLFPEVASFARRPGQAERPFIPTKSSRAFIEADELTRRFRFSVGKGFGRDHFRTPALRTIYSNKNLKPGMDEGQMLLANSASRFFETQTLEDIVIDPRHSPIMGMLNQVRDGVYQLKPELHGAVAPDFLLGFSPGGQAVTAGQNFELLSMARFPVDKSENLEGLAKFAVRRSHTPSQFEKLFGDAKGMAEFVPDKAIPGGYSAAIHMDELKKSRQLHLKQMFTALVDFNHQNMNTRKNVSSEIALARADLANRPYKYMNATSKMLSMANDVGTDNGLKSMLHIANKVGVTPQQAGLIFGAVPHAMGKTEDELTSLGFNTSWLPHIMEGRAYGISHMYSAGPKASTGAGVTRGSIEPRLFEMLEAGHYGELGPMIRKEMLSNRISMDPELLHAEEGFRQGLMSLAGKGSIPKTAAVHDIKNLTADMLNPSGPNFIGAHGGSYVKGIPGADNFFVPGDGTFKAFSTYNTPEGLAMKSSIMNSYEDFLNSGREAAMSTTASKSFAAKRELFLNDLNKAYVTVLGGKQGISGIKRGQVGGSLFLTGVTRSSTEQSSDLFRQGLGRKQFETLVADMENMAARQIADKERRSQELAAIRAMSDQFFSGGIHAPEKDVGGGLWRHPIFEKYSYSPSRFYFDPHLNDDVVSIASRESEMIVNGKKKSITMSIVKGMGGDFDADPYSVMLARPSQQKAFLAAASEESNFGLGLKDYIIRNQLLKVKSPKDFGIALEETIGADATKMGLSGQIGMLSFEMSRARAAILNNLGPDSDTAMHLLAWGEQNIISGKHASALRAGELPSDIRNLVDAIRNKNGEAITSIYKKMMDPSTAEYLAKEINVDGRTMPGLNIEGSVNSLVSSLQKFDDKHGVGLSKAREWFLGRGKGTLDPSELMGHLESMTGHADTGTGALLATEALSNINKLTAVGRAVLPHLKPLGFGIGAGLAIAAVLAPTTSTLSAPPIARSNFNNSLGDNVRPDTIGPQGPSMGQPVAPNMSTGSAPISLNDPNGHMGAMIKVRGRSRGPFNHSIASQGIRHSIGSNTSVNTRVRDDKSTLNAQKVSDIISR